MNSFFFKIFKIINFTLFKLSITKTIYFNVKYLGFSGLRYLPVFISKKTEFKKVKGIIEIKEFKTGIVRIGFGEMGNYPKGCCYSSFENDGKIVFNGRCEVGVCSTISNHGTLVFGQNVNISADCRIMCFESIKIGDNCLISWKTQLMDSDYHQIFDCNGKWINPPQGIDIGSNSWICNGVTVLKGGGCSNNVVIAANTLLTKFISQSNVIVGNGGKIIKENITWKE